MLVREACCLKVEWKRAIVGVAMCSMECYGPFPVSTHKFKMLLHASLDAFNREEIWHVCVIIVVKDIGKSSETITGPNICEAFNVFGVLR
jgi:hypothetical protein